MRKKTEDEGMGRAKRLRERRLALGLSQQAVGDAAGVKYQTVQNWEKGTGFPKRDKIDRVAACLQTSRDYLEFGTGPAVQDASAKALKLMEAEVLAFFWGASETRREALLKEAREASTQTRTNTDEKGPSKVPLRRDTGNIIHARRTTTARPRRKKPEGDKT